MAKLITFSLLMIALVTGGFAHMYNMFNFPYFENDEGTYLSYAWALSNTGELSPYTYWYDHAPFGWIMIAGWMTLTGGYTTFGLSLDSGRIAILIVHLISTIYIFIITQKLTKNRLAALLACCIFSFSPLGIYFQRRILLDNLMIMLLLAALNLVLQSSLRLSQIILSAVIFGLAVLTKENAIFLIPAFLYTILVNTHPKQRTMATSIWLTITFSIVSLYLVYAAIKSELFPSPNHVSLLSTLQFQASRGTFSPFWDSQSDINIAYHEWIKKDPYSLPIGLAALGFNTVLSIWQKQKRPLVVASYGLLLFFLRGKLIIDFYVIPWLALNSIQIAMAAHTISLLFANILKSILFPWSWVKIASARLIITTTIFACSWMLLHHDIGQFTSNETGPQRQALTWITQNVDKKEYVGVDGYMLVDLWQKGYSNADWFWKIWEDPAVQKKISASPHQQLDRIALTHEMLRVYRQKIGTTNYMNQILSHNIGNAMFGPNNPKTYIDFASNQLLTTNGDWVAILQRVPTDQLHLAWSYYKNHFIKYAGQVIDPASSITTSEGQAYSMQRALTYNDKVAFDQSYEWANKNLRRSDYLYSWLWQGEFGEGRILDQANATDADIDIARNLLLAANKWNSIKYQAQAKPLISAIWQSLVVKINNRYYLVSSSQSYRSEANAFILNPSYFDPAAYRLFAQIDPEHPWNQLANDTYATLDQIAGTDSNLPSDWVLIDAEHGHISSAQGFVNGNPDNYSFDAFRVFYRISLDAILNRSFEAKTFLERYEQFFSTEWDLNKGFKGIYTTDKKPIVGYNALSSSAGPFALFTALSNPRATEINQYYGENFNPTGYWQNPNNYYDHNWTDFAINIQSYVLSHQI